MDPGAWVEQALAGEVPRPTVAAGIWLHALRYVVPSLELDARAPCERRAREIGRRLPHKD